MIHSRLGEHVRESFVQYHLRSTIMNGCPCMCGATFIIKASSSVRQYTMGVLIRRAHHIGKCPGIDAYTNIPLSLPYIPGSCFLKASCCRLNDDV